MAEHEGEERGIQQRIETAVVSRLQHFKDQADSLTMESVRRLLETDLGLEKFELDAHKRFIRIYLEKHMEGSDGCTSETATENLDKDVDISEPEAPIMPEQQETKKGPKKSSNKDEEMTEDSPIMGVLTPKSEGGTRDSSVSESRIEKAIRQRADHFLANSEKLTLAGVRRLLEEDLGLDKNILDPFKKFISQQIDQVLNPPEEAKSSKDVKKKSSGSSRSKKSAKNNREKGSDSSGSESEEIEDKVKSRKEATPRRKNKISEEPKKRKRSKESDLDLSDKKESKLVKRRKEENADSDDHGSASEDGQPQSSVEKSAQRKEAPAPVYGKQVEHLKSIIKACGMSVAPTVYKKAKQVPDNKREAFVIKELEAILAREGLSKNPSEKEIKDCKKRKETARELEGIDMTNIISSSRRRSTFSFTTPPKPEVRVKGEKVDRKNSKNKENNDKEHNEDNEEEENEDKEEEDKEKEKEEEEEEEEDKEKEKTEVEEEEGEEEDEEEEEEEEDDDDEEEDEDDSEEEFNADDDEESD